MAASAAIHGLIIVSLWLPQPQHVEEAGHTDVIVEILPVKLEHSLKLEHPVKLEHSASKPHLLAALAADKQPPHPIVPRMVKKASGPANIYRPAPTLPSPSIASSTAHTTLPVQTVAMTAIPASAPAIDRHAQQEKQKEARNTVRKHLESFKYYPASARRRGIEGDVDVSFKLVRGGHAEQVKVLKGSGYAVLDRAALTTVARAQPFPVANGQFRFHLRFRRL